MKLPKLTKDEKAYVQGWLDRGGLVNDCPFCPIEEDQCQTICKKAFSRCGGVGRCPCMNYSHSYVVRIARRMAQARAKRGKG